MVTMTDVNLTSLNPKVENKNYPITLYKPLGLSNTQEPSKEYCVSIPLNYDYHSLKKYILDTIFTQYIGELGDSVNWNISRLAELLCLNRKSVYRIIDGNIPNWRERIIKKI